MIVNCLKGKEILEGSIFNDEKIKINDTVSLHYEQLPYIELANERIYFAQIGMFIYIVRADFINNCEFLFGIEQEIKDSKMQIKNIYSTTIVNMANILERFFRYDEDFEKEYVRNVLESSIDMLDVIVDKEYLKEKIKAYFKTSDVLELTETTEMPKLSELVKKVEENKYKNKNEEVLFNFRGKEYTSYKDFAKDYKLCYATVLRRVKTGATLDELVEKKRKPKTTYMYNGKLYTISELSKFSSVSLGTLANRIYMGWDIEKAVTTPKLDKLANLKNVNINKIREKEEEL